MGHINNEIALLDQLYNRYGSIFYGEIMKNVYRAHDADETLINSFKEINKQIKVIGIEQNPFGVCYRIVKKEIGKKKVQLLLKEVFTCQPRTANTELLRKPS